MFTEFNTILSTEPILEWNYAFRFYRDIINVLQLFFFFLFMDIGTKFDVTGIFQSRTLTFASHIFL